MAAWFVKLNVPADLSFDMLFYAPARVRENPGKAGRVLRFDGQDAVNLSCSIAAWDRDVK